MFIPADQYTGLAGKIDPIEIQYIPWRSNNRRQCPYIPELRCLPPESTSFSRKIRLCSFSEQPIQKDVELLCSIADLGRKSQTAAFAKPSLGPGICLPILHANTSAYRANHMFHGTFLQTIRFKEDITRIHIEISMVFEDFIHTFCPAYIFSEKRYNRCTH